MEDLLPILQAKAQDGRYLVVNKGPLAELLQRSVGDILMNRCPDGATVSIEVKAEGENKHGNLFLETWSNKSRWTHGWMCSLREATWLWYYFQRERELCVVAFEALRRWAYTIPGRNGHAGRLWDFPERKQSKYNQPNDTWGRCVPIAVLVQESGLRRFFVNGAVVTVAPSSVAEPGLFENDNWAEEAPVP